MKVLSLFSGVGGFDMGLENAGMETVFQCEWDKHANSILHRHWPDVPKWDDVSTLTGKHILAHAPVVDVVAWGSPCQDLSVAGKRAGLEGGRSGLFHEGIRIIKELQEETNGIYPRISIWENVVGALNSNKGADFGVILDEMAEAGAVAIEWAVLDAQYFGVPQRRRRVFVIAIFDPVLAERCPNPLLPVAESLPGHLAKGKPQRKSATRKVEESVGTDGQWAAGTTVDGDILRTSVTSKWSKGSGGPSGSEYYNMVVNDGSWWDGKDTAEALTTTSNEQRMPDKQRFQAVVEQNVVGALAARDYKGVGTQYVNENKCVVEPVLFENSRRDAARIAHDGISHTLQRHMGTGGGNTPMIAIGIQGNVIGRQDHNGPAGKGHTEEGEPMFTLTSTDIHAVAYPIDTRNALRDPEKYDAQNRQGLGIGNDGDPMATLTSAHVNAVAYDEYNDSVNEVHHALRAGTKQSTDVLTSPTLTAYNMDSRSPQSEEQQRIVNAVFESTMAVRRLTPLECERLMGWPDNHTLTKADGTTQADTHRYKQCGNGVASPVAQWIAKHILAI